MENKLKEKLKEIEKRFDELFTVIVTYEKYPDENEAQKLREPIYKLKDFPNTNPKAIKSFYRKAILSLIDEEKGEAYKKGWVDAETNTAKVLDNLNTVSKNYENKLNEKN